MSVPPRRTARPATGDLDPCGQERPRSLPSTARLPRLQGRIRDVTDSDSGPSARPRTGRGWPHPRRALAGPLQYRLAQPGRQRGQRQQPGQRLGPQRAVPAAAHVSQCSTWRAVSRPVSTVSRPSQPASRAASSGQDSRPVRAMSSASIAFSRWSLACDARVCARLQETSSTAASSASSRLCRTVSSMTSCSCGFRSARVARISRRISACWAPGPVSGALPSSSAPFPRRPHRRPPRRCPAAGRTRPARCRTARPAAGRRPSGRPA